jgi:predicted transcriptional regulator
MQTQNLTDLPVTRSDGVLVGVIAREDALRGLQTAGGSRSSAWPASGPGAG